MSNIVNFDELLDKIICGEITNDQIPKIKELINRYMEASHQFVFNVKFDLDSMKLYRDTDINNPWATSTMYCEEYEYIRDVDWSNPLNEDEDY